MWNSRQNLPGEADYFRILVSVCSWDVCNNSLYCFGSTSFLPFRAAEILADISENVKALGSTLFAGSSSPSVLERSCGATPTKLEAKTVNVEAQKAEMPEFAKKLEGDFNICSDATLAGLWEGEIDESEAEGGNAVVEDGATAAGSKDTADRDDFMSLDFNEQELQILERQAAEEVLNKAVPEVMTESLISHGCSPEELILSLLSHKILKSLGKSNLGWARVRAQSLENICVGGQALSCSSVM